MAPFERNASTTVTCGSSGLELLLVAFIVLKLTGVIAWSWWWVLSPFWIPLAVVLIIGIIWLILSY